MQREEKILTEQDYHNLVLELIQSPNQEEDMQSCRTAYLQLNPKYYLMMFRTVAKVRELATTTNHPNTIAALSNLEGLLSKYTNIIPTNLPDSVIFDRNLLDVYLADLKRVAMHNETWQDFQNYIQGKVFEIPDNHKLPFLEWCTKMLNLNLAKHNTICQIPLECPINQGYDRRLQFIARMIENETPRKLEPVTFQLTQTEPVKKSSKKIQWSGTQKELAELFIRLKAKGWITDFEPETIKECFTNSNSIHQYLKPGEYTKDLGGTFEQVFTQEYAPKFHGIIQNPKHD
jgi:hypothetical protein